MIRDRTRPEAEVFQRTLRLPRRVLWDEMKREKILERYKRMMMKRKVLGLVKHMKEGQKKKQISKRSCSCRDGERTGTIMTNKDFVKFSARLKRPSVNI